MSEGKDPVSLFFDWVFDQLVYPVIELFQGKKQDQEPEAKEDKPGDDSDSDGL